MRILASTFTCCPPGKPGFTGGEDVLGWNLLQQIAKHHQVWALTNVEDRLGIEDTVKEQNISNIVFCYIGLPAWLTPWLKIQGGHQIYYYIWQVRAYFVARKLQRSVGFDLFHHITYANDWMASFIGALLPLPYIRGPGGGAHRTPSILQKEYRVSGRLWEKIRSLGQWLFRHDPFFVRGQNKAKAILICNRDSQVKLPEKWMSKSVLYPVSGVSFGNSDVLTNDFDDGIFHIVSAGSLLRIKGFGLAIRAFKNFNDSCPESRLSIIGSGPEGRRLKQLAQDLGVEDKVLFQPEIPHTQLMSKMSEAQVVLFPSMRDGGGTVVVEAMALGKPVVCLDIGGPGMHVTDECGIKITPSTPTDTVQGLSKALEKLYKDKGLRIRLGEFGQERARQVYDWDKLGDRLYNIYQKVLESGSIKGL